jgi:hypothetical protein
MKSSSLHVLRGIVILFIAITVTRCASENSSDVNQDRIYAEYELFYNANTDKTYASVIFRFGNPSGTQLELTSPSEVTFNGDVIPFDQGFSYYRKEYSGNVTSGTFVFTDTEGNTFTNTVSTDRTLAFPAGLDTIHNANSYTMTWVGDSVVADEHVDLWMDGPQQNNIEYFMQNLLNTNSFVLAANKLQALGVGATNCSMERRWEQDAVGVTGAGGKVRVKYKAHDVTIQVAP